MEKEEPLLILYRNGNLALPGATTWGEVFDRCARVAQYAAEVQKQLLAQPLPTQPREQQG
jgi:hypothetical protein